MLLALLGHGIRNLETWEGTIRFFYSIFSVIIFDCQYCILLYTEPGANVTFESLMDQLERLSAPLDTVWGVAKTLYVTDSHVMPSQVYQKIHNRAFKARSMKYQSRPIYEACKVQSFFFFSIQFSTYPFYYYFKNRNFQMKARY